MPKQSKQQLSVDLRALKLEAKRLGRSQGLRHVEALNFIATQQGYESWWHLQHAVSVRGAASSSSKFAPRVSFVLDPKDTDDLDDEWLEDHGFERDAELYERIQAEDYADEPWEASSWVAAFRFVESPGADLRKIAKRIQEVFFFPPDSIWLDGKKASHHDWILKVPGWNIIRPPETEGDQRAYDLADSLMAPVAGMLLRNNQTVRAAIERTNARDFGFAGGGVQSASFVDGDDHQVDFTAALLLAGEQREDKPFAGDELHVGVRVRVTLEDEKAKVRILAVDRVELNLEANTDD